VPSPAGPADLLADLADALAQLQLPWYLFGAQASLIWGRPRLTTDFDVTVGPLSGGLPFVLEMLQSRGFEMRIAATPDFVRQTRVLAERGERLDLARVRAVLAMLEAALGQSDLIPQFDAELARWQRAALENLERSNAEAPS